MQKPWVSERPVIRPRAKEAMVEMFAQVFRQNFAINYPFEIIYRTHVSINFSYNKLVSLVIYLDVIRFSLNGIIENAALLSKGAVIEAIQIMHVQLSDYCIFSGIVIANNDSMNVRM